MKTPLLLMLMAALPLAFIDECSQSHEPESLSSDYFRPVDAKPENIVEGAVIYVPIYSHIYLGARSKRSFATTLSVRNTDPKNPIIVTAVRYYDTAGKLVESFLDKPHALAPLASADFFVDQRDDRGGAGANFIVEWESEKPVSKPIVEAVMAGISGTQGLSFVRSGKVVKTLP